jgi:hypothetical protein
MEKDCGFTSHHDFVPLANYHEFDFMFGYGVMSVLSHDHFVLDIYFFWSITKNKFRIFGLYEMLGWFHWLYDYT